MKSYKPFIESFYAANEKFINRWTAIVPVSHSIDEETGDLLCGHSSSCSLSTSLISNNYDANNEKPQMIEPPTLEWRTINIINEMPEAVIHQKDCYKNSAATADNIANASTHTDINNLRTAKSPSSKSTDEKSEKSFN
uniref:Uncharacterized protein n=1 Tax=Panagrolaimus sp. ES5 TaxID=591445 RepID=A0AC34F0Y4_9BILA